MSAAKELKKIRAQRLALIKKLLEEEDRNPSWLARQLGLTRAGGHRYMKGANIPEENIAKICDLFDKPLSFLHNPGGEVATEVDWESAVEAIDTVDAKSAKDLENKKEMYTLLYSTLVNVKRG